MVRTPIGIATIVRFMARSWVLTSLFGLPYSGVMPNGTPIFKSRTEQRIEAENGRSIAELLTDLYHGQGLNQAEIARELRVHRTTVVELMKRHAIATGYNKSGAAA